MHANRATMIDLMCDGAAAFDEMIYGENYHIHYLQATLPHLID